MQRHNDHIINTAAFSSIGWKSLNRAEDCQVQTHICHLNNLQRIRTTAGKLNKLIYWMIHKYKTNLWPQKKVSYQILNIISFFCGSGLTRYS